MNVSMILSVVWILFLKAFMKDRELNESWKNAARASRHVHAIRSVEIARAS